MLLNSSSGTASFNPWESSIDWGFREVEPLPLFHLDNLSPLEFSIALHEYSHHLSMLSPFGLEYLAYFWKTIARIGSGQPLALLERDLLWELHWLMNVLFEGQAMYAQLHLIPSQEFEATPMQYDFMQRMAISYGLGVDGEWSSLHADDRKNVTLNIFCRANMAAHSAGVKKHLLLDRSPRNSHYRIGYHLFRSVQAYLANVDPRLSDPEIFFVLFSNILFKNMATLPSMRMMEREVSADSFMHVLWRELSSLADDLPNAISPIADFPVHPVNYAQANYLRRTVSGRPIKMVVQMNDLLHELTGNIAKHDGYFADVFANNVMSLQLCHLKSMDVYVLSLEKGQGSSYTLFLLSRLNGEGRVFGVKISEDAAAKVQMIAKSGCKRMLKNNPLKEVVPVEEVMANADDFTYFEFHICIPTMVGGGANPITFLATADDFILINLPSSVKYSPEQHQFLLSLGFDDMQLQRMSDQNSASSSIVSTILEDYGFVRSRALRQEVLHATMTLLDRNQEHLDEHMANRDMHRSSAEVWDKARRRALSAVSALVMPLHVGDRNRLADVLTERGLTTLAEECFLAAPIDDEQRYRCPHCPETLSEAAEIAFEGNVFTRDLAAGWGRLMY